MSEPRIEIKLIPGVDDAPLRSDQYQEALEKFADQLRSVGLAPSATIELLEAAGAPAPYLGEFYLTIKSGLTVAVPVIVAWLHGRHGLRVKLKVGDVEAEAQSKEEIEELLKMPAISNGKRSQKDYQWLTVTRAEKLGW